MANDRDVTVTEDWLARELGDNFAIDVAPSDIQLSFRWWRWIAHLPDDLMVLVADSEEATQRLGRERRVLGRLAERLSVQVPPIIFFSDDDAIQVRRKIAGMQVGGGPEPEIGASALGVRLADDLGRTFAEIHTAFSEGERRELGLKRVNILPSADALADMLAGRLDDPRVRDGLDLTLSHYRDVAVPDHDLVVVHGDPWAGNFAVDETTGALNAIFDFEDVGIDDRNMDLRYFSSFGSDFEKRALARYARTAKAEPSPHRILLYHIVSAFEALGHAFEEQDESRIAMRWGWVNHVLNGPIHRLASFG